MKIAVIGASGQVGYNLVEVLSACNEVTGLTHKDMDILDFAKTRGTLTKLKPEIVINTAAYHKTDECEENPERSFQVNSIAVRNLAITCKEINSLFVHYSTDYVFDGKKRKPYTEDDEPNPINVYGVSKLAGEVFVRNTLERHYLIRPSGIFGKAKKEGKENFIVRMLRSAREKGSLKIVKDQILSPTYARDLAEKTVELIQTDRYGVYHITNLGHCSWYEFAKAAFELTRVSVKVEPVTSNRFPAKAQRPMYSVLESKNLKSIGLRRMRPWKEALKAYLEEIGEIK
jgi:dTDP-4-dehydrorhamnose reductase